MTSLAVHRGLGNNNKSYKAARVWYAAFASKWVIRPNITHLPTSACLAHVRTAVSVPLPCVCPLLQPKQQAGLHMAAPPLEHIQVHLAVTVFGGTTKPPRCALGSVSSAAGYKWYHKNKLKMLCPKPHQLIGREYHTRQCWATSIHTSSSAQRRAAARQQPLQKYTVLLVYNTA
jgi:hypothetical protein